MPTNTQESMTTYSVLTDALAVPAASVGPVAVRRPRVFVPALLSGGLLWMCYFPLAQGWLAWIALVPLLVLVRSPATAWRVTLAAWLGGLVFFWPVLQWMRVADDRMYYTWAGLATYCSFYFPLAIAFLRVLDRRTRLPLILTVPAVWTALEYLRSWLMSGFPWYFLGHTQHDYLAVIQISDLAGAYAVTFLVAMVNALAFETLARQAWFRRWFALPEVPTTPGGVAQPLTVAVLLAATLAYGVWRLGQTDFADGPTVALIQSDLEQRIRTDAGQADGDKARLFITEHNCLLTDHARAGGRPLALIVWPETSYPDEWVEVAPACHTDRLSTELQTQAKNTQETMRRAALRWQTPLLLGVNATAITPDGNPHYYNSAALVTPEGRQAGRYDKMHRVPFGEYVPLKDDIPWMKEFAPYDYDYGVEVGKQWTHFELGKYRFGVVICYEDTDPELARQYVKQSDPVDFLVNISNDGWFNGSSEHAQHLAICRFRAVECRRAVARSVNMGISGVIDGNGRVRRPDQGYLATADNKRHHIWNWEGIQGMERTPLGGEVPVSRWEEFVKAKGVLLTTVPIDNRTSVYAMLGDWLPQACWLLIGVGLVFALFRPRRALGVAS
jgi:apolipoprotein N-acyltransferase